MAILGGISSDLKCRLISDTDREQVIDCLGRGFPRRSRDYWVRALNRMARRQVVDDCPRYGYLLEASGNVVGVLLQLFSRYRMGEVETIRCNLSSWCVDPAYRSYAMKMVASALRRKDITYTTISPARRTWGAVEAMGFRRFCNGQFVFAPALSSFRRNGAVLQYSDGMSEAALLSKDEREVLEEHARLGCQSLVCTEDGRGSPFVFLERRMMKGLMPCWQLIYCRSIGDLAHWSGPLGLYMLRAGVALCVADSNGPLAGLAGRYFSDRGPKYFKGPFPPALGDLSFTEFAIFGP
ncbi:hypothetical protein [Methylocapsa sp. S129]|uniref:hypothetical protein n=1 Tax=Methylocapsa sp. S129 TaxID=1641869 RepID=UPI001FEDEF90|nr:hypothetical protein [Methylocapsa sp. S129]